MKIALIVNPFASAVGSRARVLIQRALGERHDLTVIDTTKGGHAIRLAHGARRNGADLVIALGGDGTINEAANGLLGTDTLLAPLPGGSTNVFARSLGYPNDPVEATIALLDAIDDESTIEAGVGMADDRAFLFNLGIGFDAEVVGRVEQRGALKRYAGHPLFVANTVAALARRVGRKQPWFCLSSGGRSADAQLAIALNNDPYTFLGNQPLRLAPEASLDAALSVVGMRTMALGPLAATFRSVLSAEGGVADSLAEDGETFHWSDLTDATIAGYHPFPYQLDGEYVAPVETLTVRHEPKALRIVVPRQPKPGIR